VCPPEELRHRQEARRWTLLQMDGPWGLRLTLAETSHLALQVRWKTQEGQQERIGFDYTHWKGGKWYHLTFTWNAATGEATLYLGGRIQRRRFGLPWTPTKPPTRLRIGASGLPVDDLRVYSLMLGEADIAAVARLTPADRPTDEGLVVYNRAIDVEPYRGDLLYENDFSGDVSDWILEGPGRVEIRNGWLYMESKKPTENGHIVLWNKRDFPDSFLAEWEFSPAYEEGLCIVFFAAKGRQGEDLFDPALPPRDGTFRQYIKGAINAYHISYFRNIRQPTGQCNLRKNFGFYLVSIGKDPILPRGGLGPYRLTLFKRGAHIQFGIDGRLIIDFVDDGQTYGPVLGGGKIGLRQMAPTKAYYDNFRVYAVRGQ